VQEEASISGKAMWIVYYYGS
jgi:ribonuclease HI